MILFSRTNALPRGPGQDRRRRRRRLVGLLSTACLVACGAEQGPLDVVPIDGEWELTGLFGVDVEGVVQCRMTGTLDVRQLPGGVNTVVGSGRHTFDCIVDGEPESREIATNLTNSRFQSDKLSFTMGVCGGGATFAPGRPDALTSGITFCRVSFPNTGQVALAGTWEGRRMVAP